MLSLNLIQYHIFTWKLCGIWHWANEPKWYTVLSWLSLIFCAIIFPGTMLIQLFCIRQVYEIVEILTILPTALAGLKLCLMVRDREMIQALFDMLSKLDEQLQSTEHIRDGIFGHKLFPIKLRIFYLATATSYCIIPHLSRERILVWNSWWPFDYANSTMLYYALNLFQTVSTYYIATILSSTDIFAGCVYNILAGHLEILAARMSTIGWQKPGRTFMVKNVSHYETFSLWQRQCESELRDCIALHFDCIRYAYLK